MAELADASDEHLLGTRQDWCPWIVHILNERNITRREYSEAYFKNTVLETDTDKPVFQPIPWHSHEVRMYWQEKNLFMYLRRGHAIYNIRCCIHNFFRRNIACRCYYRLRNRRNSSRTYGCVYATCSTCCPFAVGCKRGECR